MAFGCDILTGGAGNDHFVFGPGSGSDIDVIPDFTSGGDDIDLSAFNLTSINDLTIANDGNGNAMVTLASGDQIVLVGVDQGTLTDADFIF